MHKVNICSHGVFLTWDLELSIQQSASMVTPEKPPGKARNASGRVETSLDDYGIPRDCVVGSPPSRLEDFTNTFNSPDTVQWLGRCDWEQWWLYTFAQSQVLIQSPFESLSWLLWLSNSPSAKKQCGFRFQSKGQESPAVSFSSHLEERQLKLCVEVSFLGGYENCNWNRKGIFYLGIYEYWKWSEYV